MILKYDFGDNYCYEFEINQAQKIEALAEIIAGYYDKDKIKENRKFIEKLFEDGFMADDDELAKEYEEKDEKKKAEKQAKATKNNNDDNGANNG